MCFKLITNRDLTNHMCVENLLLYLIVLWKQYVCCTMWKCCIGFGFWFIRNEWSCGVISFCITYKIDGPMFTPDITVTIIEVFTCLEGRSLNIPQKQWKTCSVNLVTLIILCKRQEYQMSWVHFPVWVGVASNVIHMNFYVNNCCKIFIITLFEWIKNSTCCCESCIDKIINNYH